MLELQLRLRFLYFKWQLLFLDSSITFGSQNFQNRKTAEKAAAV